MTDAFDRLKSALADRYTIERELGAGGMATVYLAHDAKHDRKVAVKVLRPELAAVIGTARFLTEIKVTANLQHPHILPLLDSGSAEERPTALPPYRPTADVPVLPTAFLYYVMPYVDGESLRDRLNRETQLSVEDALLITQEVADGLSYAHSLGVVHRDIKPENILLTGGHALIADFGIARAVTEAGGTRLTETGLSLGTPQYMSPEQASGERNVDGRSDVYALGCVTYEMLVGEPPHTGPNAQAIIAKVLTEPVRSVRDSRELVPQHVDSAIRKALAKLAADRWPTVQRFREELVRARMDVSAPQTSTVSLVERSKPQPAWFRALPWFIAGVLAALLVFTLMMPARESDSDYGHVTRFRSALPDGYVLATTSGGFALSRDGSQLAFAATNGEEDVLFVRSLAEEYEARRIPGTEGAAAPFFSPDGEWLGFFAIYEGKLKKVLLSGGQPQEICDATWGGADWGDDGTIVFGNWDYGLLRVPATGGIPDTLTTAWVLAADNPNYQQLLPQILPDGESVLLTVSAMTAENRIEVLSLETLERRVVIGRGSHGRYVNTGHIVYALGGDLLAVPFDVERLEVLGPSIPLEEGVARGYMGSAQMAVSGNGTLVFANGDIPFTRNRLVWVDKDGGVDTLSIPPGNYLQARVSHDATRLLISRVEDNYSLWAYDLARGTLGPLTDEEAGEAWAIWTPSGNEIVSNTNRLGGNAMNLARIRVGAESEFEALASSPNNQFPFSWMPDGTVLAFGQLKHPTEGFDMDIWMLPMSGDSAPYPFLANSWDETHAAFSPDGRWIAYASNESSRYEIYVRSYPSGEMRTQVSINGGMEPLWAPDGSELYFRDHLQGNQVLAVPVDADGRFTGVPRTLFEGSYVATGYRLGRSYDIAPDGSRFLMIAQPNQVHIPPSEFKVVVNWFSELRNKVPR